MPNLNAAKAKQMRYIGANNFHHGFRIDVNFDDILHSISSFGGVVPFKDGIVYSGMKPRFSLLLPDTHCDAPILSRDYYLIGFTDSIGKPDSFRFVIGNCYNEYINNPNVIANCDYWYTSTVKDFDIKIIECK